MNISNELSVGDYIRPGIHNSDNFIADLKIILRVEEAVVGKILCSSPNGDSKLYAHWEIFPVQLTKLILDKTPFEFVSADKYLRFVIYKYLNVAINFSADGFIVRNEKKLLVYGNLHQLQKICRKKNKDEMPFNW